MVSAASSPARARRRVRRNRKKASRRCRAGTAQLAISTQSLEGQGYGRARPHVGDDFTSHANGVVSRKRNGCLTSNPALPNSIRQHQRPKVSRLRDAAVGLASWKSRSIQAGRRGADSTALHTWGQARRHVAMVASRTASRSSTGERSDLIEKSRNRPLTRPRVLAGFTHALRCRLSQRTHYRRVFVYAQKL